MNADFTEANEEKSEARQPQMDTNEH